MNRLKKHMKVMLAALLTISLITASYVPVKAEAADWSGWAYSNGTPATIDTSTVYKDCDSSVKITNTSYTCQSVTKTFSVKPNTTYEVSVMAKNEDYEQSPSAAGEGGTKLGIPDGYLPGTPCYSDSSWKKLSFEFETSDSQTTYTIALWNGIWGGECKGTAYFCDFRLTETGSAVVPEEPESKPGGEEFKGTVYDGWKDYKTGEVAPIDTGVKYTGCDASVAVKNSDYTMRYVTKDFEVKPNTHYRISCMAKNSGYKSTGAEGGAKLGVPNAYLPGTSCYSGSSWKRLSFEFDTDANQTSYTIALWNGIWGADCKGTAYFSDFRLEEYTGKDTDEWNVLVVVFKNISAPVELDGKKFTYKKSLNDADVKYMGGIVKQIYTSLPTLSDDTWHISSVDVFGIDTTVKKLAPYGKKSYCIDFYEDTVSKEIDALMDKAKKNSGREYQQIIAVSPIRDGLSTEWLGLGGGDYRGIRACQLNYASGLEDYSHNKFAIGYEETAVVHEMLHCIENLSKVADPDNWVKFHANIDEYKGIYSDLIVQAGWRGWGKYHSDYMRAATPDGRGVNKVVFSHPDPFGWKTVLGNPVKPSKKDIQSLNVKSISAKTYTGKAIKPNVAIYDGSYKLVKGTDYTLSYRKNTNPGKAAVIITGKGKYAGDYCKTFNIKPKTASVSVSKSGSKYKVSWKKITGAYKVQIYVAEKGSSSFKLKTSVKGSSTSAVISASKGDKVKVRSYKRLYPQKYYSGYSKVVTLK